MGHYSELPYSGSPLWPSICVTAPEVAKFVGLFTSVVDLQAQNLIGFLSFGWDGFVC